MTSTVSLPELTDEKRRAGQQASLELRRTRADIKGRLYDRRRSRVELLQEAMANDASPGMKVYDLVRSLYGVGNLRAAKYLGLAGIPINNSVARCGPVQVDRLLFLLRVQDKRRKSPGH